MFGMVTLISCEGPEGPAGMDGADGTDGVDGNVSCLSCHTQVKMDAIEDAFAEHKHVSGTSWSYAGTRESCAPCHDGEAIVTFLNSGALVAGYGVGLECGSCHNDHASLEDDIDAPVRMVASVASVAFEGVTYDHGTGNVCATCHQARRDAASYYGAEDATYTRKFTGDDIAAYENASVGPNGSITLDGDTLIVVFDVPAATHVYTSSTHAGPHHGPQANMFAADMGSVAGTPFERDHHTDCASCHLSDTTAATGYGHSFEPDIAMCDACHGDALDITAEMAAIEARMDAVAEALEALHAIHVDEDGAVHPMYASLPTAQWNAFWDYMCLWEDKSHGLHNFNYAKQLLTAAENALGL
ncbi:MAG: hypothetical protein C0599_14445 [Salinivirgaceae bacterium]|nr:MAG: hypothetical protein C0599_14445 [Salinivirgaceae bacterium]